MRKLVLTILALIPLFAYAQQDSVLNKNVKVSTDYNPVITKSERLYVNPDAPLPRVAEKKKLDYNVSASPIDEKANVGNLNPQAEKESVKTSYNKSFFRLGIGNYETILGELYLTMYESPKSQFGLYVKHNSIWGNVKLDNGYSSRIGTNSTYAGLRYAKRSKEQTLTAAIAFEHLGFRYYGLNNDGSTPNNYPAVHNNMRFDLGLKSNDKLLYVISHETKLYVSAFSLQNQLSELTAGLNGNLAFDLQQDSRAGVDYKFESNSYSVNATDTSVVHNFTIDDRVSFQVKPYYYMQGNFWTLKLGLGVLGCVGKENKVIVVPHIVGTANIADDYTAYISIEGDLKTNDYESIARENRYVLPWLNVQPTSVPVEFTVGARGKMQKNTSVNLWMSMAKFNNQYFYTNQYTIMQTNQFSTVTDNMERFRVGGEFSYSQDSQFDVTCKIVYNYYTTNKELKAWYMPELETALGGNYHFNKQWLFNASYHFNGGRYGGVDMYNNLIKMKSWNDLSLGAEYAYTKNVKFFGRANNVLFSNYYAWDGYKGVGFNILLGGSIAF